MMDKIVKKLERIFLPFASKISASRYLTAIRDGFISITPMTIIGSFFYLINAVILGKDGLTMHLFGTPFTGLVQIGEAVISATMSIMAILLTFSIAKSLAGHYGADTSILPAVAVSALFILTPVTYDEALKSKVITTFYTGPTSIFLSFLCAFCAVEAIRFLSRIRWLKIKMPAGVPPNVSSTFSNLIPVILTVTGFGAARGLTNWIGTPLNDLIFDLIQVPFGEIITSPGGIIVIYFFYMLLWGFGIHTGFLFEPILTPVYLENISANAEAIANGHQATSIMTQTFVDITTQIGGAGNMLALIIAIFIVSKRADYKEIAKLGLIPAIFNISEPIMFGLPVVMNPILIMPMVLSTFAGLGIGALATVIGFMGPTYVVTTSVLPAGLLGFAGTGGSFGAVAVTAVIIAVSVVIYVPFVMVMNSAGKKTQKTLEEK